MSPEQAAAKLSRLLNQQAYTMAVTDVVRLSSLLFVALIGLVWLTEPKLRHGRLGRQRRREMRAVRTDAAWLPIFYL